MKIRIIVSGLLALCALCVPPAVAQEAPAVETIADQFTKRYTTWQQWCATQPDRALLTIGTEYRELVELGPQAAPFFAEKMMQAAHPREAAAMAEALARVTDKRFPREAWPEGQFLDPEVKVKLYTRWWNEERKLTREVFAKYYTRWQEQKAKGDLTFTREVYVMTYNDTEKVLAPTREKMQSELANAYYGIRDMGIDVLPLIAERFAAEDYDLLPIFRDLTHYVPRGKTAEARVASCLNWWNVNKDAWVVPVK